MPGLNNFQKRLVHQLVRAEFEDCVTVTRQGRIQVAAVDVARENAVSEARWDAFEGRLRNQVGMRWLVEAMVGGSLDECDPKMFVRPPPGRGIWYDMVGASREFQPLKKALRGHRTTLVGHNVLLDLVYFHQNFIGKLPDNIDQFMARMRTLFPRIVDTKYLATHHADDPNIPSALVDVDREACSYEFPWIEVPPGHERYLVERPAHEAGYDSFMTARTAVKLAARLQDMGLYDEELRGRRAGAERVRAQQPVRPAGPRGRQEPCGQPGVGA